MPYAATLPPFFFRAFADMPLLRHGYAPCFRRAVDRYGLITREYCRAVTYAYVLPLMLLLSCRYAMLIITLFRGCCR